MYAIIEVLNNNKINIWISCSTAGWAHSNYIGIYKLPYNLYNFTPNNYIKVCKVSSLNIIGDIRSIFGDAELGVTHVCVLRSVVDMLWLCLIWYAVTFLRP